MKDAINELDSAQRNNKPASETLSLQRRLRELRDSLEFGGDASTLVELEKREIDRLAELLNSAWKKELGTDKGNSDWKYITATAITRVGVVLIIIYLVQILMNFYRYNTRLVTYYNSRRDLLTLWDGKQRNMTSLEAALSPARIDFGKEPKHPFEDLIKAVAVSAGGHFRLSRGNATIGNRNTPGASVAPRAGQTAVSGARVTPASTTGNRTAPTATPGNRTGPTVTGG